MTDDAPRYARFRLPHPSETVIDGYYGDGATVGQVRATHSMATVVEDEP